MDRKVDKLKADNNKAEKGGNWPVFDFCNQFLQTSQELTEATLDLLTRLAVDGVVYAEIRLVTKSSHQDFITRPKASGSSSRF